MKLRYCLLLLFFPLFVFAKDKTSCGDKELARKDCRLQAGIYDVRLLEKTVAWSDGTWHTVDPIPMKGEALAWEKVTMETMGGRPILQFLLWDKGEGESQIQSLHWFVATAEKRKFWILSEGVVRKRRLEPPAVADVPGKKPSKPKYLYDEWEKFGIKSVKAGQLEWHVNSQKKILETKQVQDGV